MQQVNGTSGINKTTLLTFINDVAARVAALVKNDRIDPDYVSQRAAFRLFGRGNVERWRKAGKLTTCKRPGKVEYRTS